MEAVGSLSLTMIAEPKSPCPLCSLTARVNLPACWKPTIKSLVTRVGLPKNTWRLVTVELID